MSKECTFRVRKIKRKERTRRANKKNYKSMGGVAISVQRSDWFLHTAADAICSTLYPNRSRRTRKKKKTTRERKNAVDIYFFRAGKEFFCVDFLYIIFLRRFYFRSHRDGYWKSFFFPSFRSQQQPNVYGRFFPRSTRLFASDAWKCIVCNPVRPFDFFSIIIIPPSLQSARLAEFILFTVCCAEAMTH